MNPFKDENNYAMIRVRATGNAAYAIFESFDFGHIRTVQSL